MAPFGTVSTEPERSSTRLRWWDASPFKVSLSVMSVIQQTSRRDVRLLAFAFGLWLFWTTAALEVAFQIHVLCMTFKRVGHLFGIRSSYFFFHSLEGIAICMPSETLATSEAI